MRIGDRSNPLFLALGAMSVQQVFASIGRNLPYVVAPAILADLALDPAWLGIYVAIAACSALAMQLGCGSVILRHGALRMSQVALLMLTIGLSVTTFGPLALFILSAAVAGGGAALSTPASSHLLGRYATPRQAPLVFSLKQTAVPVGLLLSGLLGPLLTAWIGWRGALLVVATSCAVFAVALQPLRRRFDDDRDPGASFRLSDFYTTLAAVTTNRGLRNLSMASAAFSGLQTVFIAYFVTYLTSIGHGLAAAGMVFSAATMIAVPGRIVWGWLGGRLGSPQRLLGWLALGMAMNVALLALSDLVLPMVLSALGAVGLAMTALSWHGVLLAEAARLAPEGRRGTATGGVLSFGQLGGLVLPVLYSAQLGMTGSHGLGFLVSGAPALAVGFVLLRGAQRD